MAKKTNSHSKIHRLYIKGKNDKMSYKIKQNISDKQKR